MSIPVWPVHLPGGKAMVRVPQGGGARKFIMDANQCCCPGCPLNECAHCADTYYLSYTGSGDCNFDYDYILSRVISPPCKWYQRVDGFGGGGFFPFCVVQITCVYGYWLLTIANNSGVVSRYVKLAMYDSCPAGVYTYSSGTCPEHPASVTVTVSP